jgi:hypothetical protein
MTERRGLLERIEEDGRAAEESCDRAPILPETKCR